MKNAIIGIFITVLAALLSQPLLETFVVFSEKVTLGAATLNSCRAARNNSLLMDYTEPDENIGDLNAYIEKRVFKKEFAKAFSETLGIDVDLDSIDETDNPVTFEANDRWGPISVEIYFDYGDDDDFADRLESTAMVELEMPYIFKTPLLRLFAESGPFVDDFIITGKSKFPIRIIH